MLEGVISSRSQRLPRKVFLYGPHGIGKSTFGANAKNPIFIPTEDGFRDLNVATFPVATSYGEFMDRLWKVATGEHLFETAVIDTADWLETLIVKQVCADGGKENITDFAFGKGWGALAKYWDQVIGLLEQCRRRADNNIGPAMMPIILAHSNVVRFNDPTTDSYDRYQPALHKSSGPMFMEWADEVLFCRQRVIAKESGEGFNKTVKGLGRGERVIHTTGRPSHEAKNRLNLPEEIPLAFAAYWEAVQAAYVLQDQETAVFA